MIGYDLDAKTGLPRLLLWHVVTYHINAMVRSSSSGNGYHISHESFCEICFSYGDQTHYIYSKHGYNILFGRKGKKLAGAWKPVTLQKTEYY